MDSLGYGLSAAAFWAFIGAIVLGGIWYSIREKDAQHETLRRIIESGQKVDEELVNRIMRGNEQRPDRGLKIAGLITVSVAPGLIVLGWFVGVLREMLGVAGLIGFIGLGLLVAGKFAERAYDSDTKPTQY